MSNDDDDDCWSRAMVAGTTGWTTESFADPRFASDWASGGFEIIEGVLARRPPGYLFSAMALTHLVAIVHAKAKAEGIDPGLATGVEMILSPTRVVRADGVMLTASDLEKQNAAEKAYEEDDERRYRVLVPPTLVIESTSSGFEVHDTVTKKRFYAEFGVPNYWIVDRDRKTLTCFRLRDSAYFVEAEGRSHEQIDASNPFRMKISLRDVFRGFARL